MEKRNSARVFVDIRAEQASQQGHLAENPSSIKKGLTNNIEINTIQELKQQISELHEKISKISAENNRAIEQKILSNKAEDYEYADELAEEYLK